MVFLTLPPSILWHFCTVRFPHATSVQLWQKEMTVFDVKGKCYAAQLSWGVIPRQEKRGLSCSDSLWKQSRSTTHRKDVISLSVFFPQVQPHGLNIFLACNTVNTPRLIKHVRSGVHSILSHVQKHTSQTGRCQRQHGLKTLHSQERWTTARLLLSPLSAWWSSQSAQLQHEIQFCGPENNGTR